MACGAWDPLKRRLPIDKVPCVDKHTLEILLMGPSCTEVSQGLDRSRGQTFLNPERRQGNWKIPITRMGDRSLCSLCFLCRHGGSQQWQHLWWYYILSRQYLATRGVDGGLMPYKLPIKFLLRVDFMKILDDECRSKRLEALTPSQSLRWMR